MTILFIILIGFLVGLVAQFLTPGSGRGGLIATTLLGIAGSITASYLGQALGYYKYGEAAGFFGALIGSIFILFLYRLFFRTEALS